jgi:eukaryotic-like serine/threonine-protein kinase
MKNKTILLSLLLLIVVISGVTVLASMKLTALAQQRTATNLLTYQNSTFGIKIQYPSGWDKQENGTKQDTETDVVIFYPPASNSNASLDLSMDDISDEKGISVAQYANDGLGDLKHSLQNFKSIGLTTNNILAGLPAYKSLYTYVDGKTTFKDMEIGAIKGDKAYILTYEGGADEFDKYLPTLQQMINSFQITK